MTRQILCLTCGSRNFLTGIDKENGWKDRYVEIKTLIRPENHGVSVPDVRVEDKNSRPDQRKHIRPLQEVRCDNCDVVLHNGYKAIAYTRWRSWDEEEPAAWEFEFGAFETRPQ